MKVFSGAALCLVAVLIILVYRTVRAKKRYWRELVHIFVCCIGITVPYVFSLFTESYFLNSLLSAFYFSGVTWLLYFLVMYVGKLTRYSRFAPYHISLAVFGTWAVIDTILQLVNPFKEIMISYTYFPEYLARWQYVLLPLYQCHLLLSYLQVGFSLLLLGHKIWYSPKAYSKKYSVLAIGIMVIVALNAVFLFQQDKHLFDFSLFLYGLMAGIVLWFNNRYLEQGMLQDARTIILTELENALILFDNDNFYVKGNRSAREMFGFLTEGNQEEEYTLESFLKDAGFSERLLDVETSCSFQWSPKGREEILMYRCDFTVLRDNKDREIGKLFMLTDLSSDFDLLTGFYSESAFRKEFDAPREADFYPCGVAVCDINHLKRINQELGKEKGDQAIKSLAEAIRDITPEGTSYARIGDANLLFVCGKTDIFKMRELIGAIKDRLSRVSGFHEPLSIQGAISIATTADPLITKHAKDAVKSMKAKKLMDGTSAHSSLLDSLAQTLQESDSCTREHVKRTQILGEKLGIRLGLNDVDLSNLALLCLLHDIGKLGIPLEILNKPGKLTEEEWVMMRSHAEKGYRIAKASKELSDIADLILHHHECWNGKGYPDGLAQEAIPLLSRIIAVVDTYDAMTNDRPYRRALTQTQACRELMRCAGTQFDPYLVSEFIEMLKSMDMFDEKLNQELRQQPEEVQVKPMGLEEEDVSKDRNMYEVVYTKYDLDENSRIVSFDDAFTQMTGYSAEDVKAYQLTQQDLIFPEDLADYLKLVDKHLTKDHEAFLEHRLRMKDGGVRYVYCHGRQYFDSVTRSPRSQIIATDISKSISVSTMIDRERESARRSLQRWEDSIRRDPLTHLLNRMAFQNDVQLKLMDDSTTIVFLMFDLDHFKQYNDTKGHKFGDELLAAFARALSTAVEECGIAGRMGGDEFGAIISMNKSCTREEVERRVGEIWSELMLALQKLDDTVTISQGAAIASEQVHSFNELYKRADMALYEAKNKGRNRYAVCADEE